MEAQALAKSVELFGALHDVGALFAIFLMSSTLGFFSSVMTAYASHKASVDEREEAVRVAALEAAPSLSYSECEPDIIAGVLDA